MHKPIPLQKTNIESNTKSQLLSPAKRHSLITSTLHLAGQLSKSHHELSKISIKQSLRNWQAAVETDIAHLQLAKALVVAVNEWIELHLDTLGPQTSRNQRAEKLFRHIHSSLHIFNLEKHSAALKVLHIVLLHPLTNLSPQMHKQQREISHIIANSYHMIASRPNYHKISQQLFVQPKQSTHRLSLKNCLYLGVGMTFGFLLTSVLNYQALGLCTQ